MKNAKHNLAMALCIFSFSAYSQNFYLELNTGYGFPQPGSHGMAVLGWNDLGNISSIYYNDVDNFIETYTESAESINHSYGSGLNVGGAVGYNFNKHFGTEIGFSNVFGSDAQITYTSLEIYKGVDFANRGKYEGTRSAHGNMFQLVPSITLNMGLKKINPYIKLGIVIGFGSYQMDYKTVSSFNGSITRTRSESYEFSEGVSLGFSTKAGVFISLTEQLSLFTELNINNVAYSPNRGRLTEFSVDGEDKLPLMTTSEKEFEFVKNYTRTDTPYGEINPELPQKVLKYSVPFSYVGLNVGLRVLLGGSN